MCHFDFTHAIEKQQQIQAHSRNHVVFHYRENNSIRFIEIMTSTNTCDIDENVKTSLKEFRFRKSQKNAALIMKVDRPKQMVCLEEILEDVQIEELQETIPSHEPRYIVYSYKMHHEDGRISYPMCFIFYTPAGTQMELQVLYASMKLVLQKEAELTRCYEVRELEELTEEWLKAKLSR